MTGKAWYMYDKSCIPVSFIMSKQVNQPKQCSIQIETFLKLLICQGLIPEMFKGVR